MAFEINTRNNTARSTLTLHPNESAWNYDIAITHVNEQTHTAMVFANDHRMRGCAPMRVPGAGLFVRVKNTGRDTPSHVSVTCRAGDVTLTNSNTPVSFDPTTRESEIEVSASSFPTSPVEVECDARIVSPSQVTDSTPADNHARTRVTPPPTR
jgi:hypothetical protein